MTTIRVKALTGLRFVAAMMVLIGHVGPRCDLRAIRSLLVYSIRYRRLA
jgi:peptidoglycan/LPS O-acetylase OafA/YrhL